MLNEEDQIDLKTSKAGKGKDFDSNTVSKCGSTQGVTALESRKT